MIFLFRLLFVGLIIFEFLNLIAVLNFPLDFSWFGLIITAAAVWLVVELLARFSKEPKFLKFALPLSFLGVFIDASGDIFRFYSRFGWYDKAAHLLVSGIAAYLIFLVSRRFFEQFNPLIHSLFVLGISNLFGVLYEIEEYLEDLLIRQGRWLRLGDGPDTVNDLLFNLLGGLAVMMWVNLNKRIRAKSLLLCLFWVLVIGICFGFSALDFGFSHRVAMGAATPEDLKKSIEQKSQELINVTNQLKENQQKLEEVQGGKKTLQKDLNNIQSQIKQLNLSIKSSEITIEKLGLEIESLAYDIQDAEEKIENKKEAIAEILQKLQQNENEPPLMVFLKNKTLAESVFEIQNLANLNDSLAQEIDNLRGLKEALSNDLTETADKKQSREAENIYLKNKKSITEEVKRGKQTLLEQTKNRETLYQKIISDLGKKQAEIAAEIEKIEEELRLKIDPSALPSKRPGVLAIPISGAPRLTQGYGATKFALRGGYPGKFHNGIDYGAAIGTPVLAAEKGRVIAVDNQDKYCYRGAYGKYVVIQHENNLTTLYAHLSLQTVSVGDYVRTGQIIGYVGKTGYATGPHLHFTVYATQTFYIKGSKSCGSMPYGGSLNPLDYL
jgi:murein DD-endopeptidase MepM/ murein hydrolase activator NlpD